MKAYSKIFIITSAFLIMVSGKQIEIINAGIGGNTSKDLLRRVNSDVISQNPDLVLLMIGTNDMVNSRKLVSLQEYKENLNSIIGELREENIGMVLISPIPVDTTYLFGRHDREAYSQPPNKKINAVRNVMKRISIEQDLFFIDMNREFVERGYQNIMWISS